MKNSVVSLLLEGPVNGKTLPRNRDGTRNRRERKLYARQDSNSQPLDQVACTLSTTVLHGVDFFIFPPSSTFSSHFQKNGCSLWLPYALDSSERLLYLTRCHSLLRPWWMGSEGNWLLWNKNSNWAYSHSFGTLKTCTAMLINADVKYQHIGLFKKHDRIYRNGLA